MLQYTVSFKEHAMSATRNKIMTQILDAQF